jgi:glycosyltransferase involved in cell wall biosynthesis
MPTGYLEPFGNVAAEAQLCGTPVIGPDYGAFVETIEQGVTGYRCTYLGEFVQAIHACDDLDRRVIRERAVRLFGEEAGRESYRQYFDRLALMQTEGWTSLTPLTAASELVTA